MPTATVMPFALKPVAKGPLRFTKSERNALRAIGYGEDDLEVQFGACDDGDENCALLPVDRDECYPGLNGAGIGVVPQGFEVVTGSGALLGVFTSIHDAIEVARRDITTRMAAYDPEADVAAWRELFASLG